MIKFATVEKGEIVLYTKQENSTCFRKPIFEDRAVRITSKDFEAAWTEAKKHKETYYEEVIR
jgi:hypothetical protein